MPPRFFGDDSLDWPATAEPLTPRVALVVGNGAYRQSRLDNPPRDARLIAELLDRLGFDTEVVLDGGKAVLETAIVRLGERLDKAGGQAVGFFYFAGHGIQHQGANYLVPVDAQIPDTRYLKSGAIMVDYLVEELARTPSLANVIVLDACRDNMVRDTGGGLTNGLASIQDLPDGTLVAFSTAAGKVAEDGTGDHSPYALALARRLDEPGRRLEEIFFNVSRDVAEVTLNKQRPALFVQGAIPSIILNIDPHAAPPAVETSQPPAGSGDVPGSEGLPAVANRTTMPVAVKSDLPALSGSPSLPSALATEGTDLVTEAGAARPRRWRRTFLAAAAGLLLFSIGLGAALFWPRTVTIDLANPASWPVSSSQALVTLRPGERSCAAGSIGLIDGIHCLKIDKEVGLVWESGRITPPRALATLFNVTEKDGASCPAAALFESGTHCLTAISPVPKDRAVNVLNRQAEIVGAAIGLLRIAPRSEPECTSVVGEGPVTDYCLAGVARFGSLTVTALGRERYKAGSTVPAEMLTAYERIGACPVATTSFENDRFCIVVPLW